MEVSLAVLVERHGVLLHLPLLIVEKDLIEPRVRRVQVAQTYDLLVRR